MSNPIQTFTKALEDTTYNLVRHYNPLVTRADHGYAYQLDQALASIQNSTADLLEALVGEDEPITGIRYTSKESFERETYGPSRNALRAELRTKIKELRSHE